MITLPTELDLSSLNMIGAPDEVRELLYTLIQNSNYIDALNEQSKQFFYLIIGLDLLALCFIIGFILCALLKKKWHLLKWSFYVGMGVTIGSMFSYQMQLVPIQKEIYNTSQTYEEDFLEFANLYYEYSGSNILDPEPTQEESSEIDTD